MGMDSEGNIPEDVGAQAEIALASIVSTLEAAGASMADVIKMNTCQRCPCLCPCPCWLALAWLLTEGLPGCAQTS